MTVSSTSQATIDANFPVMEASRSEVEVDLPNSMIFCEHGPESLKNPDLTVQSADIGPQLMNQSSDTTFFGDKSHLHGPPDDVSNHSSFSDSGVVVEHYPNQPS